MAKLLIKALDHVNPDSGEDRRGAYKRGDVVMVQDDGYVWGRLEGPPKFFVLTVQNTGKSIVKQLTEMQDDDDTGVPVLDAKGNPVVFRRRRWSIDLDNLPPGILTALQANGKASIPPGQLRSHVRRKRDGFQFPNL